MTQVGFDAGTYNLVCARRSTENKIAYKREVNAFLEMPLGNKFVFNMMKKAGVPLIEYPDQDMAYALGESAVDMAYTMTQLELRRPMQHGCLNPRERNAQQIMSIMVHSMIEDVEPGSTIFYSVPANAINEETDADYHGKVLNAIFRAAEDADGNSLNLNIYPINEGLALVYAELSEKSWTGLGVSCGAGMVNVCFAIFGAPVFEFSLVNSGDWIDKMASKAIGEETTTFVNQEKLKADLTIENPPELVQRAIKAQYEIMIEKTVTGIKKGLADAGKKARTGEPIDIVISGGTSSPKGFPEIFRDIVNKAHLPIEVGRIIRPKDPLYSVARGCLIAAENAK
jgi:actin-like ATPase involved in cell morphogenesis